MIVAHVAGWSFPAMVAVCTLSVVGYWELWWRRPTPSLLPPLCWTAAMIAIVVSSATWVERAADRSFAAHMGQHLVIWVVVPPLMLLAHPVRTARHGGVEIHVGGVVPWLHRRSGWRLALSWTAVVTTMYGTHLTGLYDAALRHPWVHELEHVAYLGSSILLWSTVFGPRRSMAPARAGLAAAMIAPLVLLGMVLAAAERPMYAIYLAQLGPAGALRDQRAGAALMWIGMMAGFVPLVVLSVFRWAQREQETQDALERLADLRSVVEQPTA